MNFQTNKKDGFTIIEVVLVLAIAGLIFLMVFLALPALQRNQRDSQRTQDAAQAISQLQSYANSKRGNVPSSYEGFASFWSSYMEDVKSPSGEEYEVLDDLGVTPETDQVSYSGVNRKCNDDADSTDVFTAASSSRQAAIAMGLEGGVHCLNLQ